MNIYTQTYNGFVYIWRDNIKNKFYIGSHKGAMEDGYVCSNIHFKRIFKKRPHTCTRKILATTISTDLKELHALEQYWLNFIKPQELCGVKYYNIKRTASGGSGSLPKKNKPTSALHKYRSPESNAKRSQTLKGRKHTQEAKIKQSLAATGRKNLTQSKSCVIDNITYCSISEASRNINLSIEGVRRRILSLKYPNYYYC